MSDVSAVGAIFLIVFFLSLVGTYVVIRRQRMTIRTAGPLSGVINVAALIAFGLNNPEIDDRLAIIGGFVVGLAFTGAMITMASFFLNNQSAMLSAYDAMEHQKRNSE